jgi:hypothetical protein
VGGEREKKKKQFAELKFNDSSESCSLVEVFNYFEASVHDADFLPGELGEPAEVFEGDRNGFGEGARRRLQLVHDLLDGTVWW